MTAPDAQPPDYDVALSYAGEDRAYVQQVADLLTRHGVRVFYDQDMVAELWGSDLYVTLDEVYRKRARFVVVFVSGAYVSKPWTRHERQSAQARTLLEPGPYLLPVRLDDSELPGLRPTMAYLDARRTSVERLVELIRRKLDPASVPEPARGWEERLYADVIRRRRDALEPKWCDHELGYARRDGALLDARAVLRFLSDRFDDLATCGPNMTKVFDPQMWQRAFAPPGNPVLIEHLAARLADGYEQMLDLAAAIRGARVPPAILPLMEAATRVIDRPLTDVRDYLDRVVATAVPLPRLVLTIDDEAERRFTAEAARVRREHGL